MSATQAAERLGITAQAIGMWARRPGAPVRFEGRRTWLEWPAFARWREAELLAEATRDAQPRSLEEARIRKALAEAELAEIEVAKSRGEYVAVEDYERAVGVVLDRVTARLRSLPPRLERFGVEVESVLEREIEAVIAEMHAEDQDVVDESPDAGEVSA